MQRKLTSATSLDALKNEARRWLKALRANDAGARERLRLAYPHAPENPVLRDVQQALAREYGQESWKALKMALANAAPPAPKLAKPEEYADLAQDFVKAYEGDAAALDRLNRHYGRTFGLRT